jgi:hypothetical protein
MKSYRPVYHPFISVNKGRQKIIYTTTGKVYFISSLIMLGMSLCLAFMLQVMDIQSRSNLLKKNQQEEKCYTTSFKGVAFHCQCKEKKNLQLWFIFN